MRPGPPRAGVDCLVDDDEVVLAVRRRRRPRGCGGLPGVTGVEAASAPPSQLLERTGSTASPARRDRSASLFVTEYAHQTWKHTNSNLGIAWPFRLRQ